MPSPESMVINVSFSISVFTMTDVLNVLSKRGKMKPDMVTTVAEYIAANKFQPNKEILSAKPKINDVCYFSIYLTVKHRLHLFQYENYSCFLEPEENILP